MSSPFKAFRKHQKVLIVVFGIALMVSFLVVGSISQFVGYGRGGRGGASANDVVFTWKGGTVTEAELAQMRMANRVAARFTSDIYAKATERGGIPQAAPIEYAGGDPQVVAKMLLARKAEETGVVVDDAAISVYLNELGDGRVSAKERSEIFNSLPGNTGSQSALMDQLREELLAQRMQMLAHAGFASISQFNWEFHRTPIDTWESYNDRFRQVRAEIYPVAVEDFLGEIKDPSDAVLREYYEKYENDIPNPASPDPGFRKPERSKFAYLKAEYSKFLAAEKQKVTDEQIQQYYAEHKEDFKIPELPPEETETENGKAEKPADENAGNNDAGQDDTSKDDTSKDDTSKDDTSKDDTSKDTGGKDTGGKDSSDNPEKKDGEPPAPPKTGDDAPAPPTPNAKEDEKEGDENKEQNDKVDESANGDAPEGAAIDVERSDAVADGQEQVAVSPAALAALQAVGQDADEKSSEPAADDAPRNDDPTDDENDAANKEDTQQKPAEDQPSEAKAPEQQSSEENAPAGKPAVEKPAPGGEKKPADESESPAEKAPPKYKPLSEVEDQIRTLLADSAAAKEKMEEAIDDAKKQVASFQRREALWRARNPDAPADAADRPQPPSPTELAKGRMLDAGTTKMLNLFEAEKTELGKVYQESPDGRSRESFLSLNYAPNANDKLYQARDLAMPNAENPEAMYLFWRVAHEASSVPEFAEVRDQVLHAWKMEQARPLAQKRAAELAEKARQASDQSLAKSLGPEAVTTEPFARFSSMQGPPTESVAGVEYVGEEFLDEALLLQVGRIGTAMDSPKTHAYVIRVIEETPSDEERRKMFMLFANNAFLFGNDDQIFGDWMSDLVEEMKLQWKRDPMRAFE